VLEDPGEPGQPDVDPHRILEIFRAESRGGPGTGRFGRREGYRQGRQETEERNDETKGPGGKHRGPPSLGTSYHSGRKAVNSG
jgi:hypothetical protein